MDKNVNDRAKRSSDLRFGPRSTRTPRILGWAGMCVCAGLCHAGTLVVDPGHDRADDANPGTREAPLKTVSAAAARVQPGDEVLVRPGVYRESVTLRVSGRPDAPIVFRSEEPLAAMLCGSDIVTDWQPVETGVWAIDVPNLKSNHWAHPHGSRGGEWVYLDDVPLHYAETRQQMIPESFHLDFTARRLYVAPEDGVDIASVRTEYAHRAGLFAPAEPLDDIHIVGFTLRHNACWFRGQPAIRIRGRRWRVEGNHILWTSFMPGIDFSGTRDAVVRGNRIEWGGSVGIGGASNIRMLVESNAVRYCNWRAQNPSAEGTGGSKWAFTFDSRVRGNTFAYNYGSGLWFDWANAHNVYEDNLCHDNAIWGIFAEANWNEVFRGNVSFNNSQGLVIAESVGCFARHNVVFNNDYGLMIRGYYHRGNGAGFDDKKLAGYVSRLDAIPDLDATERDRMMAGYWKYHLTVPQFMSNNNALWENLLFDNVAALWEARDYGTPSALDPFVNNRSDRNLFFVPTDRVGAWPAPVLMQHRTGGYATLADWRAVTDRDAESVQLDRHPREAESLPDWAESKRAFWDIPLRRREEIRTLGLTPGPPACIAAGRWLRSPSVEEMPMTDPQVKAWFLEVEGERTLMLWTSHQTVRRHVRLSLDRKDVVIENGLLQRTLRPLPSGQADLIVSWMPTYLRGVTTVREVPATTLTVTPFSPPDRPVMAKAVFPNAADREAELDVRFAVSAGFSAEPDRLVRRVPAGGVETVDVRLVPDGTVRRGVGLVRMTATLSGETLTRRAGFSVGEAGGTVPRQVVPVRVDGRMDDWAALMEGPPLALIAEKDQIAVARPEPVWRGPDDLAAKVYAAWSPEALHLAVEVTDDGLVPVPAPAHPWDGDCVEVFLDGRSGDMQWQEPLTEGCYQIAVAPGTGTNAPNVMTWSQGAPRLLRGLRIASAPTETGYIVEMTIPLTLQNFPAGEWESGRPIKLSVLVYDKDDPAVPGTKYIMGWSFSPRAANFRDTSGWRTLLLE